MQREQDLAAHRCEFAQAVVRRRGMDPHLLDVLSGRGVCPLAGVADDAGVAIHGSRPHLCESDSLFFQRRAALQNAAYCAVEAGHVALDLFIVAAEECDAAEGGVLRGKGHLAQFALVRKIE